MRDTMYIIDEKGQKEAVVLPLKEYEEYIRLKREFSSIRETFYLMKSQKNRKRLLKAIADVKKGIAEEHELIKN